jgi:hypothetical protein
MNSPAPRYRCPIISCRRSKRGYCTQGAYKGRIIFTVEFEGKLVGWTGRSIYPGVDARYRTLSDDKEKANKEGYEPAPAPISDFLLFYDRLLDTNADTCVLCEGPFDAWRVNLLGRRLGVVATCFFTSTLSRQQLLLLHSILPEFDRRLLMLDENTLTKALTIKSDMISLGVDIAHLKGVKDPGEIQSERQLEALL